MATILRCKAMKASHAHYLLVGACIEKVCGSGSLNV